MKIKCGSNQKVYFVSNFFNIISDRSVSIDCRCNSCTISIAIAIATIYCWSFTTSSSLCSSSWGSSQHCTCCPCCCHTIYIRGSSGLSIRTWREFFWIFGVKKELLLTFEKNLIIAVSLCDPRIRLLIVYIGRYFSSPWISYAKKSNQTHKSKVSLSFRRNCKKNKIKTFGKISLQKKCSFISWFADISFKISICAYSTAEVEYILSSNYFESC